LNSSTSTNYNNTFGGITVNVYGAPGQDVDELADAVADRFETIVQQKEAVFA
jgi:cell division septum initiation protein DivIVA